MVSKKRKDVFFTGNRHCTGGWRQRQPRKVGYEDIYLQWKRVSVHTVERKAGREVH